MKLYVREIKPYIDPPALHGMNCGQYPVKGYDWVSEDMEEELRKKIVVSDSWSKLIFKERFVEIYEPQVKEDDDDDCYDDFWYENIGKQCN